MFWWNLTNIPIWDAVAKRPAVPKNCVKFAFGSLLKILPGRLKIFQKLKGHFDDSVAKSLVI